MSLSQKIEVHKDYMVVVISGEFSLAEVLVLAKEMFDMGARHEITKALVDIRQMTGVPQTMERYKYAQFLATGGATQKNQRHTVMRMAYLGYAPTLDPTRFGENVANNRGAMVKSFFDEQAAWAWIGIDKEPGE